MVDAALIAGIGLLFACLAWWQFRIAIGMLLVLLPTYLLRFQVFSIPMTVLEVLMLVVFAIFAVRIARKEIPNPAFPWRYLVLFFLLTGAVAVLISPDTRQALGLYKAYILEPALLFVVLYNTMRDMHGIRMMLWALGSATILIALVAILQSLDFVPIPGEYGLTSPPRATSVFPFPTAVGKFVGPILALFFSIFLVRSRERTQPLQRSELFFLAGVILFGFLALVLSISRGAIVGVFAATVFSALFTARRKILFSILALIVIAALSVPSIRTNVADVFRGTDTSTDVHLVLWQGAARIIADYPLTGTGLASFPIVYDDYRDPAHVELFPNPDQLLLTIWIELGFAGIIVFAWIFGRAAIACRRIFSREKGLAIGLGAAFLAVLVHGVVDTPYFKNDLAVVFWALLACAAILEFRTRSDSPLA